ncbi:DNA/RNA non-specific endonuclease [Leuconostoc lactis]|uniref:DNA/RNA non-specific endonuclease n=1 Tax=Leuconostoc lactis TaxID=1246 RepID=UPI00289F66E2|nr:DNA/RNA non-specific endonuclease [Leuconostoc lactis]
MMFQHIKRTVILAVFSSVVGLMGIAPVAADQTYRDATLTGAEQRPLAFSQSKQLVLGDHDDKQRATDAHIQLANTDKPTAKRAARLTYNPVGWHNYRFKYEKSNGKISKEWLFNRGHLVGYQFSGLNDESKNLVPETAYLNAGALKSMNAANKQSMLYYENHLAKWLKTHKGYRLDYQVTPLYRNDELLPRQVRLAYVGYNPHGEKVKINLHSYREENGNDDATVVYLNNDSPNAIIDYSNGTARNTLNKAKTLKAEQEAADQAKAEAEAKANAAAAAQAAAESAAAESAARAASEAAAQQAAAQSQAATAQTAVAPAPATGNINNTGAYKWAIQDGYTWQTRKGHSTRVAPGGALPAGYHWQVQ